MPEITHKIMSSIKSKNTRPEMALRRALWSRGMRYQANVKFLPGKPDIVFTRVKIAVFCDGDYWHGHNWAIRGLASLDEELEQYSSYWKNKILGNIRRDKDNTALLESAGWQVIRFWESEIKANVEKCAAAVVAYHNQRALIASEGKK
jgi:DNA mismatch endonuclease (patch repair protein)